ncbi:F-box/RNI/FBD-like domain protein [Medicago truncatula]|uniref:F-box/RNI/FBD-like domain protein n=1 Tax=Medicago truncatula TaxID=3880 RepID=A0A072TXL3_MEDTR|nr:F-box/RNI/FBD-like domain protein [Medicago truncatula]
MGGILSSPAGLHKLQIQKHNAGDEKDMISNLPDDILHYILCFLPIQDVVRTSILATKWRYLWTNVSVINFEIGHVKSYDSKSVDYLDQVDKILHKSNCVVRICVKTQGGIVGVAKVSTFISSVVKHKVHDLKISLKYLKGTDVLPNRFTASHTLNKLHLKFPRALDIPSGISFPGLKTLVVSKVYFRNEKSVEQLFLGCPVLQELTLDNCHWMNIRDIHFAISTLRKLTIYSYRRHLDYYNHSGKCTITIDVKNLLSLCCQSDPEVEFFLVKPTSIVDADIDLGCCTLPDKHYSGQCAIELLSGLSSVKSLSLSDGSLQYLEYSKETLHHLPSFQNLTHLLLRTNTFTSEVVTGILLKTPNLKALHIHTRFESFMDLEDDWTLLSVPYCFEYSLKSFCVSDFLGLEQHIQFIKFVLKNARVLEEIRIVCSSDILTDRDNIKSQLEAVVPKSCLMTFL